MPGGKHVNMQAWAPEEDQVILDMVRASAPVEPWRSVLPLGARREPLPCPGVQADAWPRRLARRCCRKARNGRASSSSSLEGPSPPFVTDGVRHTPTAADTARPCLGSAVARPPPARACRKLQSHSSVPPPSCTGNASRRAESSGRLASSLKIGASRTRLPAPALQLAARLTPFPPALHPAQPPPSPAQVPRVWRAQAGTHLLPKATRRPTGACGTSSPLIVF